MTKEKTKLKSSGLAFWLSSVFCLHSWVLDPVLLAPGVDVGVVGVLDGRAVLLLGEGGLGEEGKQPIEVDQLEPALLHGVEALLVR